MNEIDQITHTIILYSKPGCHLCEHAKAALYTLTDDFKIELSEVDINSDPKLFELYQYTIPVMIVDNHIILEAHLNAKKLRRAMSEGFGPKYVQP